MQNADKMNVESVKQVNLTLPTVPISEDCLYLNIYTPVHAHEGSNLLVSIRSCSSGEGLILLQD